MHSCHTIHVMILLLGRGSKGTRCVGGFIDLLPSVVGA
jgi:hypothetical protein